MPQKSTLNIGLLGFGTVGQGVWKHLQANSANLEQRLGGSLYLAKASTKDLSKIRSVSIPKEQLTDDPWEIVNDPQIDIVCELIGGTDLARKLTLKALEQGKTVVSANKALICEHGQEIFDIARTHQAHFFFEASVAGGIPIIKTLREGLVANRFSLIHGILNGTSNYILTRMEQEGLPLETVLADARKLGYVEADESLDLDGWDAAHKAVILTYLAHGFWADPKALTVEGIRSITPQDMSFAKKLGYKIKLLAIIENIKNSGQIAVGVHPTLIPEATILASVDDVFNGISITGDVAGTTFLVGRGAGQDATASAVISDIADAASLLLNTHQEKNAQKKAPLPIETSCKIANPEAVTSAYYFRMCAKDKPGVLAEIAEALAAHEVSVASMLQESLDKNKVALVITTHRAPESQLTQAIKHLEQLDCILEKPFFIRILDSDL
tara:strand:- start:61063 stop:62385 length:1323 start_codon:yes stop_codon:yes gene_type:complete